jgi:plasmid stabilization system protein ParE
MTRHTVVWTEDALAELAELWTTAPDRNAVTAAAQLIDMEPSQDAATRGVEVAEGLRALFAPPLRILFAVDEEDRLAEVARVRRL